MITQIFDLTPYNTMANIVDVEIVHTKHQQYGNKFLGHVNKPKKQKKTKTN